MRIRNPNYSPEKKLPSAAADRALVQSFIGDDKNKGVEFFTLADIQKVLDGRGGRKKGFSSKGKAHQVLVDMGLNVEL